MRHIADCIHRDEPLTTLLLYRRRTKAPVFRATTIALVPYTRLVHMFGAPVQYPFRPYVAQRSRDPRQSGPRPERRGRERTGS
jgi:nitrate reductase gamma subunit